MNEPAGAMFTIKGERIALRGVDIRVVVRDAASRVTVVQRYENAEKDPVEAVYSFPLEESSAVCGFEVEIGGRTIVGRVEEKEAAFEAYDQAMSEGHGAFLLDRDRPNIFTASVGNLAPGQKAAVKIVYVAELDQSGKDLRLMIPTTISPRYIPSGMEASADPSELDRISPPVIAGESPYGLTLRVDIEISGKIKSVRSPSHPIAVELNDNGASVELASEKTSLDQDFVLTVETAEPHVPTVCLAKDGADRTIGMVNFFPDFSESETGPQEVVFVLDCSGSMYGESIEQAKAALLLCLRSLEAGDRFNVILFGSTFTTLFAESAAYDQKNLDVATEWVGRIDADLGGTEIMAPLKAALSAKGGVSRSILLMTDGEVGNEKEVIDMASRQHGGTRIFTFGIGRGASEYLVRGLARAAGGAAEFIFPGERIQSKVLKQLSRLRTPYYKEISVDWGGLNPDTVAPYRIPALFDGDRLSVYGRFEKATETRIALTAKGSQGTRTWEVHVDPNNIAEESPVPALFARKAIRDLEEGASALHRTGSKQRKKKEGRVEEALLELSKRYGILSSVASMVAVEKRDEPVEGEAVLRRIPVSLTRGWGGADRMLHSAPAPCMAAMAAPSTKAKSSARRFFGNFLQAKESSVGSVPEAMAPAPAESGNDECEFDFSLELNDEFEKRPAAQAPGSGQEDLLMKLTLLQRADGSWPLTDSFADAAEVELSALQKAAGLLAAENDLNDSDAGSIVATLAAMHLLKEKLGTLQDEWTLLFAKAEKWIAGKSVKAPSSASDLQSWIADFLRSA